MPITGIVHDTTLAPSWQEQTGYGYITLDTLAGLGEPPVLDELRILLDGNPMRHGDHRRQSIGARQRASSARR